MRDVGVAVLTAGHFALLGRLWTRTLTCELASANLPPIHFVNGLFVSHERNVRLIDRMAMTAHLRPWPALLSDGTCVI